MNAQFSGSERRQHAHVEHVRCATARGGERQCRRWASTVNSDRHVDRCASAHCAGRCCLRSRTFLPAVASYCRCEFRRPRGLVTVNSKAVQLQVQKWLFDLAVGSQTVPHSDPLSALEAEPPSRSTPQLRALLSPDSARPDGSPAG